MLQELIPSFVYEKIYFNRPFAVIDSGL